MGSLMKIRNKMVLRTLRWRYSSLDRERRRKDSVESHMFAREWRKSVIKKCSWPGIREDAGDSLERNAGCQAILKARDIPKETALISCSLPKRPPIIVGRVKAASPRQIDLVFIQIDYLSRDCWRKGMILCQL